ncbi:MAG: thiamine pyrophosphate-binding protein [Gemmataceae bacterium]|nr:thiamine pyrophosphate-binding protein [Gemmataceae bacterium]MDW8264115.1 thiamine pyrophosphate-binding protein [Gemmataceae bacterium]
MFDGPSVAAAFRAAGITHVLWVPDSQLGRWDSALRSDPQLRLVRVCREGEAIAVAGGLLLGGARPIVLMQCTGLFEAGDALRNIVHDLRLPLFLVVDVRSWRAYTLGKTTDTCPLFTEPIMRAWQIPYVLFEPDRHTPADLAEEYRRAWAERRAGAVLLPE